MQRWGVLSPVLLILLVITPVGTRAQDNLLPEDELVFADLAQSEIEGWAIDAEAGDLLIIDVQSDDFDPVLELYFDGDLLLEMDDGGIGNDTRLVTPPLPESGEYLAFVSSVFESDEGTYVIRYQHFDLQAAGELDENGEVFATMGAANSDEWQFEAVAGAGVRIAVQSDTQDLLIALYGPDDTLIASDDDSGGDLNPLLTGLELPADGDYRLVVEPATSADASGAVYQLSVANVLFDAEDDRVREIEVNSITDGYFSTEIGPVIYPVALEAGETVFINARSDDFDTVLRVEDEDGNPVAEDDDSGIDFRASALVFSPEQTGSFTIIVDSFGAASGYFELRVFDAGADE